jgi:ubiquinone biosynthesis protein
VAELQAEAPRYAKLLPELPRLLHQYLSRGAGHDSETLLELL